METATFVPVWKLTNINLCTFLVKSISPLPNSLIAHFKVDYFVGLGISSFIVVSRKLSKLVFGDVGINEIYPNDDSDTVYFFPSPLEY